MMRKFYLLYFFLIFSCGEKKEITCLQNIEIAGSGMRINVDSAKEEKVFQALLESEDEHHYISIRDFSTVEIDTNTLKSISKAYAIFRKEVQEGSYLESRLVSSETKENTLSLISPIEADVVFKESAQLTASSFPNYDIAIGNDIQSNLLLLGQKYIESIYWEAKGEEENQLKSQNLCLKLISASRLDLGLEQLLSRNKMDEFMQELETNQSDFISFQIGYRMEYLRICHELYNLKNNPTQIQSYLEEKIAEKDSILYFRIARFSQNIKSHLLEDILYLSKIQEGTGG